MKFVAVSIFVGWLLLFVTLALTTLRKSALGRYFAGVYPLARVPPVPSWLSSDGLFLYGEARNIPAVNESWGSRPLNDFKQRPEIREWWSPVWFPNEARIRNEYPPDAWWQALPTLRARLERQRGFLEITHVPDDLQRIYRVYGTWFYATPGSGVYLETGRALVANNKLDALSQLGMSWHDMAAMFSKGSYMDSPNHSSTFDALASGQVNAKVKFESPNGLHVDNIAQLFEFAVALTTPRGRQEAKKRGMDTNAIYQVDRVQNSAVFDARLTHLARKAGYDVVHFLCQANGNGGWAHELVFVKEPRRPTTEVLKTVDERNLSHLADRLWIADPLDTSRRERCQFLNNDNYVCLSCLQQTSNPSCRSPLTPSASPYH